MNQTINNVTNNINHNINNTFNSTLNLNNSQNVNETFSFQAFSQDFATEIISEYYISENLILLILYLSLIILTYKIFNKSYSMNKDINNTSLNYFAKSFLCYSIFYLIVSIYYSLIFFLRFEELNYIFTTIFSITLFILMLIMPWIARTYLIDSILFKYFEKKVPTKFAQKLFFLFLAVLIAIDFIVYVIMAVISKYLFIGYNILILGMFLYLFYKKHGIKRITKHIPQLTIILLLTLRLTTSFDVFFEEEFYDIYFEYLVGLLTFIIYAFILIRLKRWEKILTK